MTGKAQSWRSILWLWGTGGSGKGGIMKLLWAALGDKAITINRSFFLDTPGDIDDALANVLEKQPTFLMIDEFGSSKRSIDEGKLLSRTGDTPQSARRPHGHTITGNIHAMVVVATVTPPSMRTATGLKRRLAVLGTGEEIPPERKDSGYPQDLRDAVVTLAAQRAITVMAALANSTYVAPEGDITRKAELLASMDPVASWLDALPDDSAGMSMADLAEQANRELAGELDDGEREVTATLIGRRVRTSAKWRSVQERGIIDGKQRRVIRGALNSTIAMVDNAPPVPKIFQHPTRGPVGVPNDDLLFDEAGFAQLDLFADDEAPTGTLHVVRYDGRMDWHWSPYASIADTRCVSCRRKLEGLKQGDGPSGGSDHPVQAFVEDGLVNCDDDPEAEWETQQLQALYDSHAMERFAQRHMDALGGAYWVYTAAYRVLLDHEGSPGTPDWHALVSATLTEIDADLQQRKEAMMQAAQGRWVGALQRVFQGLLPGLADDGAP